MSSWKFITFVLFALIFGLLNASGQSATFILQGRVVSQDGNAVDGATIEIEGMQRLFQSDDKGEFRLVFPNTYSQLKISVRKLGYVATTKILGSPFQQGVNVVLETADNVLQEVQVFTGYQNLPKERATGSFEVVDKKLYERQISTDIISRLDGIMPSVLFDKREGGEQNMIVRGVSSLGYTETGPLIVVDNFPFEGSLESINPNDVENVTLLKDAAAASIWGAKAGNGVLVITTKKGAYQRPWTLSAVSNTTITEKPDLYYMPRMSSSDFIDTELFLFGQGAFDAILNNVTTRPSVTPVVELLDKNRKGELSELDLQTALAAYRQIDTRDDLLKHFYRTGVNQQYATSLSGGGDRYHTNFSLGYDKNQNTSVGSDFSRINMSLQNSFRPIDKLEVNLGMRYARQHMDANQMPRLQMALGRDMYPYARLVGDNGEALVVERDYRLSYLQNMPAAETLLDWRYRPYEELSLADNQRNLSNLMLTANMRYQINKGIAAEVFYQYETQQTDNRQFSGEQTYFTRNLINRFSQLNGETLTRIIPIGGILDRESSTLNAHSFRGQFSFNREWNSHAFYGIAGSEIRHAGVDGSATRHYGYDDEILTHAIVDYLGRYPIFDNLGAASTIPYLDSDRSTVQRFVSFYANTSYTYAKRYTISASARNDASNLFGVETNNRWTPLWSIGGMWDIAEEPFYNVDFISKLKLRATYGHSGNVSNSVPAVTTLEYRGTSRLGRNPFALVSNPPNPLLRWENVATFNVGLDFGLTGNHFFGSIEYYNKNSSDLLSLVNADPTTGFTNLSMNSAEMVNSGVDITLNGNVRFGSLRWDAAAMLSVNKNRVRKYLFEVNNPSQWVANGSFISPIIRQPAYVVVSHRFAELDPQTGDPIGYVDGELSMDYQAITQQATKEDLVFHGSALPEYYGAFRNSLQWSDFSLSANLTYRAGYYFRRNTITYATLFSVNGMVGHGDYNSRWREPGDELSTTIPSANYPTDENRDAFYRDSEVTVEKGDHIRLQDVNFSYVFDGHRLRLPFSQITATFYARNLGIIWRANKNRLDPDVGEMPLPKTYALGLTLNF